MVVNLGIFDNLQWRWALNDRLAHGYIAGVVAEERRAGHRPRRVAAGGLHLYDL